MAPCHVQSVLSYHFWHSTQLKLFCLKLWYCAAHRMQWSWMTLANWHTSLFPSETRMNFQRCIMFVTISCCSSVALQLMHQCLNTAPSHIAAVETPSCPLFDCVCWGSDGGKKCPSAELAETRWSWTLPGYPTKQYVNFLLASHTTIVLTEWIWLQSR